MLQVTKIFRFETAHAIQGYSGQCSNLHGHSYILHVTVATGTGFENYLPPPGFILDFKELKRLVNSTIIASFDHRTILSEDYIAQHPPVAHLPNIWIWQAEPTAENILLYIRNSLQKESPAGVLLRRLRINETGDSYAEWEENKP